MTVTGGCPTERQVSLVHGHEHAVIHNPFPNLDIADPYSPTTIKIKVQCDLSSKEQVFTVPSTLLRGSSKYFDRALKPVLLEGQTREVVVTEVDCWVVCCLVGWVYGKQLRWDPPHEEVEVPTKQANTEIQTNELWKDSCKRKLTEMLDDGDDEDRGKKQTDPNSEEVSTLNGVVACDCARHSTDTSPVDPIKWSWDALFQLYVFADKYDPPGFRSLVFVTCQIKHTQAEQTAESVPKISAVKYLVDRVPRPLPLRRFIRDIFTYGIVWSMEWSIAEQADDLHELGAEFMADCYVTSSRHTMALLCEQCGPHKIPGDCEQFGHEPGDELPPSQRDWCFYHEHDTEIDKEICRLRREAMDWRFGG